MNDNSGFIVINRKILKWEWYQDTNTLRLFIHLLLMANWEDKKWNGMVIKRGEFITSRKHLAKDTGLSEQQVRTALNKLISTNEITKATTNKYTLITINNYKKYQNYTPPNNQQITTKQPTNNQQITTTKQYKQTNKNNNNNISTTTNNRQSLFELIEENFGRTLNSIEIEELSNWEDNELTRYVIKKTILSNVYSIKYISKILYTYKQKGIKTVVDAEKEYKQFEKEKNSKSNKKNYKSGMDRFNEVLDSITEEDLL